MLRRNGSTFDSFCCAAYPLRGSSVCGSDLYLYHSIIPGFSPTATEPHPTTKETLPITMGHEFVRSTVLINSTLTSSTLRFSGTIVDIGPKVDGTKFAVGQHVAMYVSYVSVCALLTSLSCREPSFTCLEESCVQCANLTTRNLCPKLACQVT